jgi:TolB-like protein/class 3 adenylate cyclase/Tfp pilus assembly protein PilF
LNFSGWRHFTLCRIQTFLFLLFAIAPTFDRISVSSITYRKAMADQEVKRRLAAILAADVAGYTRLMEEDTDGTVAAWKAARENVIEPVIGDHSGLIIKFTGDGFLVEFSSVLDAVTCAIQLQESLAASTLDFRMGINLGDIVDDGNDIHGEGVNIAARIEGLAEPGGICISGSVHEQVRNRLDHQFDDRGEVEVKNVSDPIRVFHVLSKGEVPTAQPRQSSSKRIAAIAAVGLLVLIGGIAWWQSQKPDSEAVNVTQKGNIKPSVAVLPFTNMSGDKSQEYFSDGMTEDLITDLAKISDLTVISRTSTSGYKGRKIDIREVGEALGVRYVIEGSVRKIGDKVRINAQLIDAKTGGHLWAERYDGNFNKIFSLQDKVLEKIVASLALKLSAKDRQRLANRGTDSVEAHDLYMRGLFQESRFTREANGVAVKYYEQALAIDPDYALPYTRIANILELSARNGWSDNIQADLKKAVDLATKAIVLDPQNPYLHWSLGRAVARLRTPETLRRGIKALERAVQLDPNYADAHAFLTVLYIGDGRANDGLKSVETAMKINPRYPFWYLFMRGMAHYVVEEYKSAIEDLEAASERSPTALFVRWYLAAAYAQAGQQDDAEWQVEEMRSLGFKGTIDTIIETGHHQDPKYLSLIREGMRKAGISEAKKAAKPQGKPSIAVLPFTNMSGDKEQEYFSDGMTEDLITDLSKISGLTVIARNSTFAYKGKSPDVRDVAKNLGVRFVLEGSVRKAGNRVRINAQLINAETGSHLWAERYDGVLDDVFGLQDKVTAKIVSILAVKLTASEQERIAQKETENTEAYDIFLKGWEQYLIRSPEGFQAAIKHFKKAIALDPDYSRAYAALAATYWEVHNRGWHLYIGLNLRHDALFLAETMLENALKDPTPLALQISSTLYSRQGSHENAIAEAERAIALDPNDAYGYLAMASTKTLAGKPEEAIPLILKAMRLNPHFPSHYLYELGLANFTLGQYLKAADVLERASALSPEDVWPSRLLLAVYGHLDRQADIKRVQGTIRPGWADSGPMTIKSIAFWYPFKKPEHVNRLAEGLRKAGIPD